MRFKTGICIRDHRAQLPDFIDAAIPAHTILRVKRFAAITRHQEGEQTHNRQHKHGRHQHSGDIQRTFAKAAVDPTRGGILCALNGGGPQNRITRVTIMNCHIKPNVPTQTCDQKDRR